MENSDIMRIVSEITKDVSEIEGNSESHLKKCKLLHNQKNKKFASMYPKLFDICFTQGFDADQFRYMMQQLQDVHASNQTFEVGTSNVTNSLNNKFIIPLVGQPDTNVDTNDMNHLKFSINK
jgi:hypothetical protein